MLPNSCVTRENIKMNANKTDERFEKVWWWCLFLFIFKFERKMPPHCKWRQPLLHTDKTYVIPDSVWITQITLDDHRHLWQNKIRRNFRFVSKWEPIAAMNCDSVERFHCAGVSWFNICTQTSTHTYVSNAALYRSIANYSRFLFDLLRCAQNIEKSMRLCCSDFEPVRTGDISTFHSINWFSHQTIDQFMWFNLFSFFWHDFTNFQMKNKTAQLKSKKAVLQINRHQIS